MQCGAIVFEAIKLLLQFGGALLIAYWTVGWALKRYKAEKTWERRLTAYVDAVTAMSEMLQVVGRWIDEEVQRREPSEEWSTAQRQRYQAARRRLDEGIATALLLLPSDTAKVLTDLGKDLEKDKDNPNYYEVLDTEYGVLQRALQTVIEQGRKTLGPALTD